MKILVVTGESGGHIFPAISFLQRLRERESAIQTLLVLPVLRVSNFLKEDVGELRFISICSFGFRPNARNLRGMLNFIKGAFESFEILLRFKPDIVVGFGSIASIPIVMGAWLLRIPTCIHEQNVFPGKATLLLSKFADKVAVSFEETKAHLDVCSEKVS